MVEFVEEHKFPIVFLGVALNSVFGKQTVLMEIHSHVLRDY